MIKRSTLRFSLLSLLGLLWATMGFGLTETRAGDLKLCATAAVSRRALADARHEVDALRECARVESCDHERAARVCGDLGRTTTPR